MRKHTGKIFLKGTCISAFAILSSTEEMMEIIISSVGEDESNVREEEEELGVVRRTAGEREA